MKNLEKFALIYNECKREYLSDEQIMQVFMEKHAYTKKRFNMNLTRSRNKELLILDFPKVRAVPLKEVLPKIEEPVARPEYPDDSAYWVGAFDMRGSISVKYTEALEITATFRTPELADRDAFYARYGGYLYQFNSHFDVQLSQTDPGLHQLFKELGMYSAKHRVLAQKLESYLEALFYLTVQEREVRASVLP